MAKTDEVQLAVIATEIGYIKKSVEEINKKLGEDFVTKQEFDPVKKIVYGLVSVTLLAVAGAIIALVIRQ